MTWKDRISLGLCGRAGCPLKAADGKNHCAVHWKDQKGRTLKRMRIVRAAWFGPLFTWPLRRDNR